MNIVYFFIQLWYCVVYFSPVSRINFEFEEQLQRALNALE
jgi:hypothetical protein